MKGYVAIITTLVLLAVTGAIATALILKSTDGIKSEEAMRQGSQSLLFSESCMEEVLLQIVRNPNYNETTLEMPQGTCEIDIENNSGTYGILVTGKNDQYEKSIRAEAVLDALNLSITNWNEE